MPRLCGPRDYPTCPRHHKWTFPDPMTARLELVRAAALHTEQGKDKIEKRFFECELGGFHLTSWQDKAGPV
jgi:hypothetical protein